MNRVIDSNLKFDWYRLDNDVNGNPRYVTHYLEVANDYSEAVTIANTVGGRKYHYRKFGGGLVFQSYNLADTERHLIDAMKAAA